MEVLLLLKLIGVNFARFECAALVRSAAAAMKFYLESSIRKSLRALGSLLSASYLVVMLCREVVRGDDPVVLFQPLIANLHFTFASHEYERIVLPLLLNVLKLAGTDERIVDNSTRALILNALHCVNLLRNRKKALISLFVLETIVSFPSVCISLNEPCTSFESEAPVHRGSYVDVLLEVVIRGASPNYLEISAMIISAVIPYAPNLSYSSAVSLFKFLETLVSANAMQSINVIVVAIHYVVNRSIRENVPLVIVLMKNSKLLTGVLKMISSFDECDQLLSLARNISQELKQMGTQVKSTDLEKSFDDPSCERFALPVLRPPQIEFDAAAQITQHLSNLAAYYGFNELGVVPRPKREGAISGEPS
jgi:hypothetical protein